MKGYKLRFFALFLLAGAIASPGLVSAQTFERPFNSQSIWNLPIGKGATYISAGLSAQEQTAFSFEHVGIHRVNASDPLQSVYRKLSNTQCSTSIDKATVYYKVNLPNSFIVNSLVSNGLYVWLFPDNRIIESYLWERCNSGSYAAGRYGPSSWYSLTGDGRPQHGLGAAGMAAMGGTLRARELTTPAGVPIPHALKLILSRKVLTYVASDPTPGYRWPALRADGTASTAYYGTNAQIEMGSLFAIRPTETEASLGLKTEPGKKIFHAFQTYGAYVQDACCLATTPSWQAWMLGAQLNTDDDRTVEKELSATYGINISDLSATPYTAQGTKDFKHDLDMIYSKLAVVSNTSPLLAKGPTTLPLTAPKNLVVTVVE